MREEVTYRDTSYLNIKCTYIDSGHITIGVIKFNWPQNWQRFILMELPDKGYIKKNVKKILILKMCIEEVSSLNT